MGFIEVWQNETEDFFFDFIRSDVDIEKVIELSNRIMLGAYEASCAPMGAEKIIFLYGSEDKNYTSDEVSYMQLVSIVIKLHQTDDPYNCIFYIDISNDNCDKNLVACALIKIFNKAFDGKNIYCFKFNQAIAFGCKRGSSASTESFALSKWFSVSESSEVTDLCDSCDGNQYEFVNLIVQTCALEPKGNMFDTPKYDSEYIFALHDIMPIYQIDLNSEIERYEHGFLQTEDAINRYKEIFEELIDIGVSEITSYEFLEKAEKAESISKTKLIADKIDLAVIDSITLDKMNAIPEEALGDAEKILRYI
jgi:hypothetical protein